LKPVQTLDKLKSSLPANLSLAESYSNKCLQRNPKRKLTSIFILTLDRQKSCFVTQNSKQQFLRCKNHLFLT
jgi:hypothetical protein